MFLIESISFLGMVFKWAQIFQVGWNSSRQGARENQPVTHLMWCIKCKDFPMKKNQAPKVPKVFQNQPTC